MAIKVSNKRKFFISYNKKDKQWAKWIAAVLEQKYDCYIQAWDFRPGENFMLKMQKAINDSERFIAVLSPNYLTSDYCQAEWAAALTKDPTGDKRLFVPVRVADFEPDGLLANIIYIDFVGVDESEAEKRLLNGVDMGDIPRLRPPFPASDPSPMPSFPGTSKDEASNILPLNNLPFIRNTYFTGRDATFKAIRNGFESGNAISLAQTIAGMGGLGKTQTALEYAYRNADKYNCIWWVIAETESTVLASYKDFATRMNLLPNTHENSNDIIAAVLSWLDTNTNWLFIYDNVDIITGTTLWWPRDNKGNILVTTRNNNVPFTKRVDIDVFTEEEAVHFLNKRTGLENDPINTLALVKQLGCLPLALEQAAAYMQIHGDTYAEYLSLLEENRHKMFSDTTGMHSYSKSIIETMEISFAKIDLEAAHQLLYLCAYMAPEDIDGAIFRDNAELLPKSLKEMMADRFSEKQVWEQLTRYSLLKKQDDGQMYTMHRLLQEIVRGRVGNDEQWGLCCLDIFIKIFRFTYDDITSYQMALKLFPHLEAFFQSSTNLTGYENERKMGLLYSVGGHGLVKHGYYNQAMEWQQKALSIKEKVLGKEHRDTARTYSAIAGIYKDLGEYAKALEWHRRALKVREKVLGKEHHVTAITYNNIALVYTLQSEYNKALEWYQKALKIYKIAFGEEHREIATTYNNIALTYRNLGEYSKALEWHKESIKIKEKLLGKEHPDTALSYNNIAVVYENQGEYRKSLELYQKALAINEKIFGKDHPFTVRIRHRIENVYDAINSTN